MARKQPSDSKRALVPSTSLSKMRASFVRMARSAGPSWRSRMPQSSYYKDNQFSPALQRARRAYLIPNALTGMCIFGLAIGVYAYTINVVSQDEFEDVPVPEGPATTSSSSNAST